MSGPLTKADVEDVVDRRVGSLLDAHREAVTERVQAVATVTAIQVGAAEKTLSARIDGLQWKWAAALAGGQVVAGLVAALVARGTTEHPVRAAVEALSYLPFL